MTKLRTWHEILIEDLAANRAEAIDYFNMSLKEEDHPVPPREATPPSLEIPND